MANAPARTADEISSAMKHLLERVRDGEVADQVARTGREVAAILSDAAATAGERAEHAWKDSAPLRRDAASWSSRAWKKNVRPALRDLWGQRTMAMGAAGAAVPAYRELVSSTAVRLGLKRREERHWGAFFMGMLIGAAIGAVLAMLSTPKPGSQIRRQLADKARDAGEWRPLFQRGALEEENNHAGHQPPPPTSRRGTRKTKSQIQDAAAGEPGGGAASS
jgi:hypothetical protein